MTQTLANNPIGAACITSWWLALTTMLLLPAPVWSADLVVKDSSGTALLSYVESHALVIWAGDYSNNFWKKLNNLREDAQQVEAALRRQGFDVTTVANPTGVGLRTSLESFVQRFGFKPNSRLVIYFAGHGWTRNNDLGYLVPVDAPDASSVAGDLDFARQALSMEQILSWAKQMEAKHVLFIFDSCFSGAVFKVRSGSRPPAYLERKISLPVRQFITAGDANEVVPARSLFTPLLVRGLDGEADLNHDGYITGSELGDYLPQMLSAYSKDQNPQYGKIRDPRLDEGDIVFRSITPPAPSLPDINPPRRPLPPSLQPLPDKEQKPNPPDDEVKIPLITPQPPPDKGLKPNPPLDGVPVPNQLHSVLGESSRDRASAEREARERLPKGAIEQRGQCNLINVAGTDHYKCILWYSLSAATSSGKP